MSKIPTNRSSFTPSKPVFRPRRISSGTQQTHSTAGDPSGNPFRLADRVTTNGKSGTIAYIGRTQFAEGEWIGVILDEAHGKNDGSYNGVRYFETVANRGLFCRADKIQHLLLNGVPQRSLPHNPQKSSIIADKNNASSENPTTNPSSNKDLQLGDEVVIRGTKFGTLKYIGRIHINDGIWCGIKLDGPLGKHNGKIEGVRYFRCQHRFGIFAPLRHVEKIVNESEEPRSSARQSILSTCSSNRLRDSSSPDSNLSEFSTSTNSLNHFPTRSPTKTGPRNSFPGDTALSTQISDLLEQIKVKNLLIEQLQQQMNKDRLEHSHTTEKMTEMDINILVLQQQYNMKENENEQLIKQQDELTQRLEDLQFQLEEYQYPETDAEPVAISNDHRVLSPNEIYIYEKTKEKVVELQSINKNLLHEKQIYQEELKRHHELVEKEKLTNTFINELKKQIELLKSQVTDLQFREQSKTSQLNENETFYKQQIKEYQLQINQITKEAQNVQQRLTTLEQEKQTNDKRMNDLLSELKRHKESLVPDLEKQCQTLKLELQNRDRTANMAINERQTYYEQQIKQYQDNINQLTRETDKIRAELNYVQEEKELKEQKTNTLMNELKYNYEKVQTELNHREHQVHTTLNQRESLYEQQIKEYENQLNHATQQTENIQSELAQLEVDKTFHEQKSNDTVHSLKQDYERQYEMLKTQFVDLKEQDNSQNIILNERIARYEIEIKEYQLKIDQDAREIQNLQNDLTKLHREKISDEQQLNSTIDTLKQDFEKLQNELNNREQQTNLTLAKYELHYKQQIEDYKNNLQYANQQIENLQIELENLQKEKISSDTQFNDTIIQLKQDYETLKIDLSDHEQTQNVTINEREIHYQSQIEEYQTQRDQTLLDIQGLQTQLTKLQEENTINENQLNETINTLKQDHEVQCKELQLELDELNEREHKAHKDLHQRESQFDQQITEYQDKLEQANLKIQYIQSEFVKLQEEKNQSDGTINTLQHDLETLKVELQDQDHTQNMASNEREIHYQSQIKDHQNNREQYLLEIQSLQSALAKLQDEKVVSENELNKTIETLKQDLDKLHNELNERDRKEKMTLKQYKLEYEEQIDEYQKNLELSIIQNQNLQTDLANLQEEKGSNEKNLNAIMNSVTQDFEQQTEILKKQNTELQEHHVTKTNELTHKEREINEYEAKFKQLNEQIVDLNQQNETKINQMHQLKTELDQKHQANKQITNIKQQYEQTQDELIQRTENVTTLNEKLKKEIEELKNQNQQLLKSTDIPKTPEIQVDVDQLNKQINDLQQMHADLLEKQANSEQKYAEEKIAQEKITKEKIADYQMNIALMKSEYMVEMENTKLDHDQEILRLKTQLQQATAPTKSKGKK